MATRDAIINLTKGNKALIALSWPVGDGVYGTWSEDMLSPFILVGTKSVAYAIQDGDRPHGFTFSSIQKSTDECVLIPTSPDEPRVRITPLYLPQQEKGVSDWIREDTGANKRTSVTNFLIELETR